MSANKKAPGQRGVNGKGQSKGTEFILEAERTGIPNFLILTVLYPNGNQLGEALITLAQWNNETRMRNLINDMLTMQKNGIDMALIQEKEVPNA